MIKLDIISDVACPWCYIGKAYLDRALEQHPDHPFTVEWHPYQLDPEIPAEGIDRTAYMEAKFGTRERIIEVHKPILEHAARAGIEADTAASVLDAVTRIAANDPGSRILICGSLYLAGNVLRENG